MSLIKFEDAGNYAWAVWEITETIGELYALSNLTAKEKAEFSAIKHAIKRREYLAGRLTVKAIVEGRKGVFKGIIKDNCGKPFLVDHEAHISLSHSFPFAGAILHDRKPTGIDIERPQEKLLAIAHKFLSEKENVAAADDQTRLCVYWCAKEALYKVYGRKQVIFTKHIAVEPFSLGDEGILQGKIIMPDHKKNYQLRFVQFKGHMICFNI